MYLHFIFLFFFFFFFFLSFFLYHRTRSNSLLADGVTRGDLVGGLVRLAFHDAAEYLPSSGDNLRADGCVDLTNGDNGGLAAIIFEIQDLWLEHCHVFSRADFWFVN